MEDDCKTVTVRYRSFFKINNNEAEEIDLDDIDVDINTSSSVKEDKSNQETNFLALEEQD